MAGGEVPRAIETDEAVMEWVAAHDYTAPADDLRTRTVHGFTRCATGLPWTRSLALR